MSNQKMMSPSDLVAYLKQKDVKRPRGRRLEMVRIGCELYCLTLSDIQFILDKNNDLHRVEAFYHRKVTC